jgi:hypothetical protein
MNKTWRQRTIPKKQPQVQILTTCHQVYEEAIPILMSKNTIACRDRADMTSWKNAYCVAVLQLPMVPCRLDYSELDKWAPASIGNDLKYYLKNFYNLRKIIVPYKIKISSSKYFTPTTVPTRSDLERMFLKRRQSILERESSIHRDLSGIHFEGFVLGKVSWGICQLRAMWNPYETEQSMMLHYSFSKITT